MGKKNLQYLERAVLVTTVHRGVFFGYVPADLALDGKVVRLVRARLCVRWSKALRGVLGLASTGPTADCRIGPQVLAITLQDVTAVVEVSETAAQNWENAPWRI